MTEGGRRVERERGEQCKRIMKGEKLMGGNRRRDGKGTESGRGRTQVNRRQGQEC